MIVEVLSDHPRHQLHRTEAAVEDHHRRAAEHERAVSDLRAHHAASRRWWQLGKRLEQFWETQTLRSQAPVLDPRVHQRLAQQGAGVAAEDRMTFALRELPDDWTLFRGYANRRGEVDHLLVGPGGVWAIEVKGRAVHVHVRGDHWSYEKFDRYGNLVDRGVLADRRGRSWGRQVSEIASALQDFLASRGAFVTVESAVVVINDRASLGAFENSSATVSIGTDYLMNAIRGRPPVIDLGTCRRIAALVRRDHAFHAKRRAERRR